MSLSTLAGFTHLTDITYAQRGVLALILALGGAATHKQLAEAGKNKAEAVKHLTKQLKKLGYLDNPRQRDANNRFLASPYVLTDKAKCLTGEG
ncbi:MarR family transcriptional regulator [Deinococcus peraridilitoris]|uniref:HTH marR-type domain-containing protein n=1 Tax=Deinococcus peraridilitoris (strain DSM 19664 / LMG 22246 / CIP 109416 / KR-200) TaxID=937777 RepID=L0A6R7_DEIPD|nr:MarR family transcriptional regulator [Deinococcus peraridilitoris]AFZ69536.1 hypothetical protein Deipe_4169 [Deinococcus peraridilitoris DSM 19664]